MVVKKKKEKEQEWFQKKIRTPIIDFFPSALRPLARLALHAIFSFKSKKMGGGSKHSLTHLKLIFFVGWPLARLAAHLIVLEQEFFTQFGKKTLTLIDIVEAATLFQKATISYPIDPQMPAH